MQHSVIRRKKNPNYNLPSLGPGTPIPICGAQGRHNTSVDKCSIEGRGKGDFFIFFLLMAASLWCVGRGLCITSITFMLLSHVVLQFLLLLLICIWSLIPVVSCGCFFTVWGLFWSLWGICRKRGIYCTASSHGSSFVGRGGEKPSVSASCPITIHPWAQYTFVWLQRSF